MHVKLNRHVKNHMLEHLINSVYIQTSPLSFPFMKGEVSHMTNEDEKRERAPAGDLPPPSSDEVFKKVIENVLELLTSKRDRNAASAVCRSWYDTDARTRRDLFIGNCYAVSPDRVVERFKSIKSIVLKGKPRFADFNLVPYGWGANFTPWVKTLGDAYQNLESISLKRMVVTDENLMSIADNFPLFKDLSLVCCEGFSTLGLAVIAERCRHLRVLDLMEDDLEDEENEAVDWISKFPETTTSLESLVFDCVGNQFDIHALEGLVARSPSLRCLRVNQHVTLEQLHQLMLLAPQINNLGTGAFRSEKGSMVADPNLNLVSAFASSKSLNSLSGFREIEPEHLPAIYPVCANLTSLNISYANLTADQLNPVIRQCHNLQTFWVLDTVGDEGLQAVAETCHDLRELRVFPFDPTEDSESCVSDIGLQFISEGCHKLHKILYFCQRMTNAAVTTMSNNCPNLVVFRLCIMGLHKPDRITGESMDEGFGAIVINCKKLIRLSVSGLLTDKAFEYIGRYGKLIRTLSVAFAGDSDLGLRYVLEGCTRLQKLEIRDCPFGDSALISGLPLYYNMRFLWMSSCNLSMRGCREVAQSKPNLVVEVIKDGDMEDEGEEETVVERLYMYRSLAGPRTDAPPFVKIL